MFDGKTRKNGGYTLSDPKEWTEQEVNYLLARKEAGVPLKDIALELNRTAVSVQIKYKRLTKKQDTYNQKHRDYKYAINTDFYARTQPKTILDVFAGNSFWLGIHSDTTTNDIDLKYVCEYALPARRLLAHMEYTQKRFDLVDLDPYGSAYDCLDLAMGVAKTGLIVSFGEYGHLRWKRLDYVAPRYGITSLDVNEWREKFIQEVQRVAATHKKEAELIHLIEYGNFIRCYFQLSEVKITSQWQ